MVRAAGLAVLGVLAACGFAAAEDKDKGEAIAKAAVEAFAKAFKAGDAEAVLKVCDVPFAENNKRVIKERDELKQLIQKAIDDGKNAATIDIKKVGTLAQIEEAVGKKLPDERRTTLEEVGGKDYRIVTIEVTHGEKVQKAALAVKLDGATGKVVAILD